MDGLRENASFPTRTMEQSTTVAQANSLSAQLVALRPYTAELGKTVTCAICLDYLEDAQQLHCGHIFCAKCVSGLLGMKRSRCAICNRNTTKRGIRDAPVDFNHIVARLREIEAAIDEISPPPTIGMKPACNDGFKVTLGAEMSMRRTASTAASPSKQRSSAPPVQRGLDGCVLCPASEPPRPSDNAESAYRGKLTKVADSSVCNASVHEYCGDYTEGVYEVDHEFYNVVASLFNFRDAICSYEKCKGSHAGVRCGVESCERRYHFGCALFDGAIRVEDGFKLYCRDHSEEAPNVDDIVFAEFLTAPDTADYKQHDNNCFECGNGGRLIMCDTCERAVHLVCAGLTKIPAREFSCAACINGCKTTANSTQETPSRVTGKASSIPRTPQRSKRKQSRAEKSSISKSSNKRARRSSTVSVKDLAAGWKPILCSTGLSEGQRDLLRGVASMHRTMIRKDFDKRVTHMIINAFLQEDTPTRTMKLCKAIAAGAQLICFKWVEDSAGWIGSWKNVDKYVHPWTLKGGGYLFSNMRFYFGALGSRGHEKDDLVSIVKFGGGEVLNREPNNTLSLSKLILVEVEAKKARRASLKSLSSRLDDAELVEPTWILDRCTASTR